MRNEVRKQAAESGEERRLRRTREHCKRIGLVVSALALLTSPAWAQGQPAQAPAPETPAVRAGTTAHAAVPASSKKLLASAEAKRAAGDYASALADYQASDAILSAPASVEGIAFCHDKLGHFDEALTWYERFLAGVPVGMQLPADEAKARLEAIRAMPGHLRLETNPSNAVVLIDGNEQATHTPLEVDLSPGKHAVHVTAADHDPVDKEVAVTSRTNQDIAFESPGDPSPATTTAATAAAATTPAAQPSACVHHRRPRTGRRRDRNRLRGRSTERQEHLQHAPHDSDGR